MPLDLLNPRGAGAFSDWSVVGASSGWEALQKGSSDSSYIAASALASASYFDCGDGRWPISGFVAGLFVRVRIRRTASSTGGAVNLLVIQNGIARSAGFVTPPNSDTSWVDREIFLRVDWSTGLRFTQADLLNLGVGVNITGTPSSGGFQISQLYLELEQVSSLYYYDPFSGLTPEAIVGERECVVLGAQPASITIDHYLEIVDSDIGDLLFYVGPPLQLPLDSRWVSEIETRVRVDSVGATPDSAVCVVGGCLDETSQVLVNLLLIGGVPHIGICPAFLSWDDPTSYVALAPFDFVGQVHHFKLTFDRFADPADLGLVQVWIDHAETPILEVPFVAIPTTAVPPGIYGVLFGTSFTGISTISIDYITWRNYKRQGYSFQDWIEEDQANNLIYADADDSQICKLVEVAPGIKAGQSNVACKLEAVPSAALCQVYTIYPNYEAPVAYDLNLTFRATGPDPVVAVFIQRVSDLFYWNNGTALWQIGASSVSLSPNIDRTIAAAGSGITTAGPNGLIITIRALTSILAVTHVWLYHVQLTRS